MAKKYRKIPFKNRQTGMVAFALDPILTRATGDNLMDGLPPLRFRGDPGLGRMRFRGDPGLGCVPFSLDPALSRQTGDNLMDGLPVVDFRQAALKADFPGEPYVGVGDYNALAPGAGLSGAKKTVVVRPNPASAPGWAGFFDWVANNSPKMYDYLRVTLPNFVEDRQSYPAAGAALGGYDAATIIRGLEDGHTNARFGLGIYNSGNGMGADVSTDPLLMSSPTITFAAPDVQVPVMPAVEGVTNAAPLPTSAASSSIIDTIQQAAAAFLPLVTQQKLLNINIDRASKGLPPIDTAAYESASQGLNVGINRSTQNTFLMLAAGLGGIFLLSKLLGKR